MDKLNISLDIISDLYLNERKSLRYIANLFDCSVWCIRDRLVSMEISINKCNPIGSQTGDNNPMYGLRGDASPNHGRVRSMDHRIKISATKQGIDIDDWNGFSPKYGQSFLNCVYLNERFDGCHRHHITKTIVACIPADLHNIIRHNSKTGKNMGEINIAALQYIEDNGLWSI